MDKLNLFLSLLGFVVMWMGSMHVRLEADISERQDDTSTIGLVLQVLRPWTFIIPLAVTAILPWAYGWSHLYGEIIPNFVPKVGYYLFVALQQGVFLCTMYIAITHESYDLAAQIIKGYRITNKWERVIYSRIVFYGGCTFAAISGCIVSIVLLTA